MIYVVKRTPKAPAATDPWAQGVWSGADELELTEHIRDRPEHFPPTRARLLYDEAGLYVYFQVEDRYVRAVAQNYHDPVCRDSCAEFFFTPSEDLAQGYFNVEINCTGVLLMYHQTGMEENRVDLDIADCRRLEISASLPDRKIDPEITDSLTWEIRYRIPYDMLSGYAPVVRPEPGVIWRANFYKCADETSHPHWISWAKIDHPNPHFHLPEFFGTLRFSGT